MAIHKRAPVRHYAAALNAILNDQATAAIVDAPSALSASSKGIKVVTYLTD